MDDETWAKTRNLLVRMNSMPFIVISDAYNGILTPEQERKLNESLLANMGDMPIISQSIFEGLNLSDTQKQQVEALKKEFDPELEKYLERHVNNSEKRKVKISEVLNKQEGATLKEKMQATNKILVEDTEYEKIWDEIRSDKQAFTAQFVTKMHTILTDEQKAHLQSLIDDPPEYAKIFGKYYRGEHRIKSEEGGEWQPGPDSWKPGDPIPEQYLQERNTGSRFPRTEE